MNTKAINEAIAVHCGYRLLKKPDLTGLCACYAISPNGYAVCGIPDYCNDLNAMHEAEEQLNNHQWYMWLEQMAQILRLDMTLPWYPNDAIALQKATALQRAEAFCKTLGIWNKEWKG